MANVALPQGAEDRIANRMDQNVRVRMTVQTFGVMNIHAAQDEFATFDQTVHVVADAHVNHGRQSIGIAGQLKVFPGNTVGRVPSRGGICGAMSVC